MVLFNPYLGDLGVLTFRKGISPEVNAVARLDKYDSHYAMENPPNSTL